MSRSDYTPPTFVDVANPASPPPGAVALDAAHVNAMAQAIANSAPARNLSLNVKDYGAKGDGTTDDATAIQAAITAATTNGGTVLFPVGTYIVGSTLTLPTGVHLRGVGIGGDVFSDTDGLLPFTGTVLKLKAGANVDLIKTANFDTLTGSASPGRAAPGRFGLHDMVLDGNKYGGNTTGVPLRMYGKAYQIENVTVQNGAAGGVYSEYGSGGYEMEARWANWSITDCGGDGLTWKGPHDSQFVNGVVARNDGFIGVNIVNGAYVGGEMFANVHVWGSHTYQWSIGNASSAFINCVSDGPGGVRFLGSGNQWLGGSIFGSNAVGQVAVTLGDGTVRNVFSNVVRTRFYNYAKGAALVRITANTTNRWNVFQSSASMGGNTRYSMGAGQSTTSGAVTFPASTITVADASSFPTGGGGLYLGDGTNVATPSYTGVSGNTLTGVTGGSGTIASGAAIFSTATTGGQDNYEIIDSDNTSAYGVVQALQAPGNSLTYFWLSPTSFSVGSQILRPNSTSGAYTQLRNETGRVDLNWDNSGTAGLYSYQNGATVEGRTGTASGTKTWKLNSALGTVQSGSAVTGSRPSAATAGAGAMFYDTTLSKPIFSDGTVWRDATGTAV